MSGALYLGVDGGGTGCRARIEDAEGRVLGQGLAGPATLRLGAEGAFAAVLSAARAAALEAGLDGDGLRNVAAGVALAGIGRKGSRAALEELPHPWASVAFASDGHAACLGAHSGRDGAIVIAGTGSIGLGYLADRTLRVGGYGFPVSDEGSGADIGLRALQLSLRAQDGRGSGSALTQEVMHRFGGDPFEVVAWMDRATASDYATLAPLVLRHADQGDAVGRLIVQTGAEQIDGIVRALLAQGAPRIALLGGLASALEPWLSPDVRRLLRPAEGDAVAGAILLAGRPAPGAVQG